jgi:hypothetical protein
MSSDIENRNYELHYNMIDFVLSKYGNNSELEKSDNYELLSKYVNVGDIKQLLLEDGVDAFPLLGFTIEGLKKDLFFSLSKAIEETLNSGKVMLCAHDDDFTKNDQTLTIMRGFLSLYAETPDDLKKRYGFLTQNIIKWIGKHDHERINTYLKALNTMLDDSTLIVKSTVFPMNPEFNYAHIDIKAFNGNNNNNHNPPPPSTSTTTTTTTTPQTPKPSTSTTTTTTTTTPQTPKTVATTGNEEALNKEITRLGKMLKEKANKEAARLDAAKVTEERNKRQRDAFNQAITILKDPTIKSDTEKVLLVKKTINRVMKTDVFKDINSDASRHSSSVIDLTKSFEPLRQRISSGICSNRSFVEA